MIQKAYTIRDNTAEIHRGPYMALNRGLFLRSLVDITKNPDSDLAKWPSQFEAFETGEWDDSTGILTHCPKLSLGLISELTESPESNRPLANGSALPQISSLKGKENAYPRN